MYCVKGMCSTVALNTIQIKLIETLKHGIRIRSNGGFRIVRGREGGVKKQA